MAIGGTTAAPLLYAANNAAGTVDVFNGSFQLAGQIFAILTCPRNPRPVQCAEHRRHDLCDLRTGRAFSRDHGYGRERWRFLTRTGPSPNIQLTSRSQLASPWGIALAPAGFGQFSGDLLVGNFAYGNLSPLGGEINAYDPTNGNFLATLDSNSAWQGLWALTFGNGGSGGSTDILYFTTGLNAETDGLFAALSVPEPSTIAILGVGLLSLCALRRRRPLRLRDEAAG